MIWSSQQMHHSRVLVVEDEPEIAELIRLNVEREGFKADVVHAGEPAVDFVQQQQPDLVLLDLMLPDIDGLEVCRRLKWEEATRNVPIIMVTARGEESDVVTGLEMGADDYVTKPFSPKVLAARIRNVLRRMENEASEQAVPGRSLAHGSIHIDLDRHVVAVDGSIVELTVTEFDILKFLCERPGFVRTRDQIIQAVHGDLAVLSKRTIDVHITALRRKLGASGSSIQTVRGVGYRFEVPIDHEG
jgi:DNA-binding response OmpR family regulator